jgi:aconitase B
MTSYITGLLIVGLLIAVPSIAGAQQTSPDQKRLDVMVGKWNTEVDTKATPLSPASKATGTEECQWFANRHVVCRSEAKAPTGSYSQMRTLSYLPARKQYVAYTIDSLGSALVAYGQINGDTWTFATDQPAFNIRLTLKIAAGGYTALAEFAGADGKYLPLSEVKATRAK